eukprot:CAMPEP_0114544544 /NCGR_PEP_ID=MMETSP0114-20121206/2933_1 /TAXON_ID=31324 /ORGANISM="Goniomonas sp, Strain m" /LENGTH=232 /DNA_ID=CAMNT_0001728931 /DNA_START=12 /DNA_END=706 /DNA_ORIENTATION=+
MNAGQEGNQVTDAQIHDLEVLHPTDAYVSRDQTSEAGTGYGQMMCYNSTQTHDTAINELMVYNPNTWERVYARQTGGYYDPHCPFRQGSNCEVWPIGPSGDSPSGVCTPSAHTLDSESDYQLVDMRHEIALPSMKAVAYASPLQAIGYPPRPQSYLDNPATPNNAIRTVDGFLPPSYLDDIERSDSWSFWHRPASWTRGAGLPPTTAPMYVKPRFESYRLSSANPPIYGRPR